MAVSEPVRRLALCPFHELPVAPDVEQVELDGAFIAINKWPTAQIVGMRGNGPTDLEATVEAARAVARERSKTIVAWWVPPDQDHVVPALEAAGLVEPGHARVRGDRECTRARRAHPSPTIWKTSRRE